jgi:hypothetical protein
MRFRRVMMDRPRKFVAVPALVIGAGICAGLRLLRDIPGVSIGSDFDPGGATASRIAMPHMLPSTIPSVSASAKLLLTPPHVLTVEALDTEPWWEAALTLPLPENPSLQLLDDAREQVIEFLNWASEELAPIAMPEHISAEITRASERLIELSLARRAILTVERFRRWLPDDPA